MAGQKVTENTEIRKKEYNSMLELLIMLIAPSVIAVYYYSWRAALIILISVGTAVLCERIGFAMMRRKSELKDLSAVCTGLMIALMMSASTPLWIPVVGSAFAVIVAKLPFGSSKAVLFIPAAVGFAFLSICWPDYVFSYPTTSLSNIVYVNSPEFIKGLSLASMLQNSSAISFNTANVIKVLIGNFPGPMGASCPIVLLAIAVVTLIRKPKKALIPIGFGVVCLILASLFPRVLTGRKSSVLMELCSGLLLFSAIILLPDETTAPKGKISGLLYGAVGGLICMLIRYFGTLEEGACYAVLIMNALSSFFDRSYVPRFLKKSPQKQEEGGDDQ